MIHPALSTSTATPANPAEALDGLLDVVARLRNPEGGCPWDLAQTHASLKKYLLEEAYETLEAIDDWTAQPSPAHDAALCEELGDVLLQVALHSQLAAERQAFCFAHVASGLADKLVRRHPHVFQAQAVLDTPAQVTAQWQQIKATEKQQQAGDESPPPSQRQATLARVSRAQPALSRASDVSKKAVAVGFAWPHFEALWQTVHSELDELAAELPRQAEAASQLDHDAVAANLRRVEAELGDVLFSVVSLANHLGVDPETALTRATDTFTQRFSVMEAQVPADVALETLSFEAWDTLWQAAKQGCS